jgi:hypothetical protein
MHGRALIAGTRVPVSGAALTREKLLPRTQSRRRDDE